MDRVEVLGGIMGEGLVLKYEQDPVDQEIVEIRIEDIQSDDEGLSGTELDGPEDYCLQENPNLLGKDNEHIMEQSQNMNVNTGAMNLGNGSDCKITETWDEHMESGVNISYQKDSTNHKMLAKGVKEEPVENCSESLLCSLLKTEPIEAEQVNNDQNSTNELSGSIDEPDKNDSLLYLLLTGNIKTSVKKSQGSYSKRNTVKSNNTQGIELKKEARAPNEFPAVLNNSILQGVLLQNNQYTSIGNLMTNAAGNYNTQGIELQQGARAPNEIPAELNNRISQGILLQNNQYTSIGNVRLNATRNYNTQGIELQQGARAPNEIPAVLNNRLAQEVLLQNNQNTSIGNVRLNVTRNYNTQGIEVQKRARAQNKIPAVLNSSISNGILLENNRTTVIEKIIINTQGVEMQPKAKASNELPGIENISTLNVLSQNTQRKCDNASTVNEGLLFGLLTSQPQVNIEAKKEGLNPWLEQISYHDRKKKNMGESQGSNAKRKKLSRFSNSKVKNADAVSPIDIDCASNNYIHRIASSIIGKRQEEVLSVENKVESLRHNGNWNQEVEFGDDRKGAEHKQETELIGLVQEQVEGGGLPVHKAHIYEDPFASDDSNEGPGDTMTAHRDKSLKKKTPCPHCHKIMISRSLRRHILAIHVTDNFRCQNCGFTCNSAVDLRKHIIYEHAI